MRTGSLWGRYRGWIAVPVYPCLSVLFPGLGGREGSAPALWGGPARWRGARDRRPQDLRATGGGAGAHTVPEPDEADAGNPVRGGGTTATSCGDANVVVVGGAARAARPTDLAARRGTSWVTYTHPCSSHHSNVRTPSAGPTHSVPAMAMSRVATFQWAQSWIAAGCHGGSRSWTAGPRRAARLPRGVPNRAPAGPTHAPLHSQRWREQRAGPGPRPTPGRPGSCSATTRRQWVKSERWWLQGAPAPYAAPGAGVGRTGPSRCRRH